MIVPIPEINMYIILLLIFILSITTLVSTYFLHHCKRLLKYVQCDKYEKVKRIKEKHLVSIVIPTYNESFVIKDKIRNTLSLKYQGEIEIYVIDSASTDGTSDIAAEFEEINVVRQSERRGKSSALAEVFSLVKGDIILITDADAMLDEDVIPIIIEYLSNEYVGAITGKQVLMTPGEHGFEEKERSYRDIFDFIRTAESNMHSTMIFNGPLMAFKKEVLEAPSPDSVADDTEMALLVIKKGYRALYAREAIFYENIPLSDKSRLKQKERRAQGLVQSFWRHRDMIFNNRYGKFGTEIFPAEFAVHIVLPFALLISCFTIMLGLFNDFCSSLIVISAFFLLNLIYAASTYTKISRSMGTGHDEEDKRSPFLKIAITATSFLQLQYALLMGSLKLMIIGNDHKWEQISDARYKRDINNIGHKKMKK